MRPFRNHVREHVREHFREHVREISVNMSVIMAPSVFLRFPFGFPSVMRVK